MCATVCLSPVFLILHAARTLLRQIYSSVTIWAALFSKLLLSRSLSRLQWLGICLVVVGLSLTALDSLAVGQSVFFGCVLILVGSSFHGKEVYLCCNQHQAHAPYASLYCLCLVSQHCPLFEPASGLVYVLSEKIMTAPSPTTIAPSTDTGGRSATIAANNHTQPPQAPTHISVRANCAIQGIVAVLLLLSWQLYYTLPRLQTLVLDPMAAAGTSPLRAAGILGAIALANLVHSVTFFATLKHFPGGATSAGVLKGLQAVLVFALSAAVLCGRWGGAEMCWSRSKGASLVVVVAGIALYGTFTEKGSAEKGKAQRGGSSRSRVSMTRKKGDYHGVGDVVSGDAGRIMCV